LEATYTPWVLYVGLVPEAAIDHQLLDDQFTSVGHNSGSRVNKAISHSPSGRARR
jgi:hypothetical protein